MHIYIYIFVGLCVIFKHKAECMSALSRCLRLFLFHISYFMPNIKRYRQFWYMLIAQWYLSYKSILYDWFIGWVKMNDYIERIRACFLGIWKEFIHQWLVKCSFNLSSILKLIITKYYGGCVFCRETQNGGRVKPGWFYKSILCSTLSSRLCAYRLGGGRCVVEMRMHEFSLMRGAKPSTKLSRKNKSCLRPKQKHYYKRQMKYAKDRPCTHGSTTEEIFVRE